MIDLDLLNIDYEILEFALQNGFKYAIIEEFGSQSGTIISLFRQKPSISCLDNFYSLFKLNKTNSRWEKLE